MTKFIREIFALFLVLGLAACGGGGGSPGNVSGGAEFFVSAPDKLVLLPGEVRTFAIGGGVPGYSASTSNSAIQATISDKTLTLKAVGTGSATVVVKDSTGKSASIEVTLGTGVEIYSTAPASVLVGVGQTSEVFSIGGGTRVYEVTSSNTRVATVGVRGDQFIINGVSGGKATVTVADTLGKKVSIDVIVGSNDSIFTTAGTDITLGVGNANIYKVGGGTTSYSVGSSDTNVATAKITGSELLITGVATGKAVVNVRDSAGNSLTINVTVGLGGVELFTTAPASLVLPVGASSASYAIGGGKAPYTAVSSNSAVVVATVSGTTMSLRPIAAGTATISITDALGKKISVSVAVGSGTNVGLFTDAPPALTLNVDAVRSYKVAGGTGPYTVASSNNDVVEIVNQPSTNNGNVFDIKAKAVGTASLVIKDSLGSPVTVAVTVSGGANISFAINPSAISARVGDDIRLLISGGTPDFTVQSSNLAIADATIDNATKIVSAQLKSVGNAMFIVRDAKGQMLQVPVTVDQANTLMRLAPSAMTISENSTANIPLSIFGGTGPYTLFSSDTKLLSVPASVAAGSATFNIGMGTAANRCVTGDYAVTITIIDKNGISATSVVTIKDNPNGCP